MTNEGQTAAEIDPAYQKSEGNEEEDPLKVNL